MPTQPVLVIRGEFQHEAQFIEENMKKLRFLA
jgi:hypothetical protein